MKKSIFLATLMLLFSSAFLTAQVTIGSNNDPNATLDVVAADPTDANAVEGVIAPRLTGDQIKGKDGKYGTLQNGAIVYATVAVSGTPAGKTINITAPGYYYYNAPNSVWQALGGGSAAAPDFIVSPEITDNYVMTKENFLRVNIASGVKALTLATSGIPVGHVLYISNAGLGTMSLSPLPRNTTCTFIDAGGSYTFVYLGEGVWDVAQGW